MYDNNGGKMEQTLPKVLLVEDDKMNSDAIVIFLKKVCQVEAVSTGMEAIEKVSENKYALILMDIGLRGIDGLETTKKIRQLENYNNCPIAAVTSYAMTSDKETFLAGGCTHYLAKPFTKSELERFVQNILDESKSET